MNEIQVLRKKYEDTIKAIGDHLERDTVLQHLYRERDALKGAIEIAKKITYPTKCCRCWPRDVGDDGFCGCCEFDHTTGQRTSCPDPEVDR